MPDERELSCYSNNNPKCELGGLVAWNTTGARPRRNVHDHAEAARRALRSIAQTARRQGYELPVSETKKSARRILDSLAKEFKCHFEVYPTEEGEIAIQISGGYRRGVLISLERDGSAMCFLTIGGTNDRKAYKSADELPDYFARDAIRRILE